VGLGLSLNPSRQEAFLIPRDRTVGKDARGNWIKVREFNVQYGWRGLIKLATRNGRIARLKPVIVYEGDHFVHHEGTAPRIEHIPCRIDDDRGPVIAAYACAWERGSAEPIFVVCYRDVIEAAAEKSGGASGISKVWEDNLAEMSKKTAVRRLCKLLPDTEDDLQLALLESPDEKPAVTITQAVAEFEQPEGPTAMPPRQVQAPDGLDALIEGERPQ
jgi:recombination protein RecT